MQQYNLRLQKSSTVQVPVHIDTSENHEFLEKLLKSCDNNDKLTGSGESDISDLDCSDLLNVSDESDVAVERKPEPVHDQSSCVGEQQATTLCSATGNAQDLINCEILQQLQTIGKWLDNLETQKCKKTTDPTKIKSKSKNKKSQELKGLGSNTASTQALPEVGSAQNQQAKSMPSLFELRQDPLIQDRVQQPIQELNELVNTGDSKIKSQRGGVDIFVKHRVKWPHEYVLSGSNKERGSYDQLSVVQWVAGFCRTMKVEKIPKMREHMLDYLVALLDDAQDFSWGAAKASHAVLLCRMEQGEIVDYSWIDQIDRIRRANAPKILLLTKRAVRSPQRSWPVLFSIKIHVLLAKHMKQKVSFTDTYVWMYLLLESASTLPDG